MRLVYSREALNDLVRLRGFIAQEHPRTARQVAAILIEGINKLRDFPLLGKAAPRAPDSKMVRDLILGKYIVRYLVLGESISILRIWHHREDHP